MAESTRSEDVYEEEHVHQVYNKIASHFSSTRFKPWPVVDEFLRALPVGSLGIDVGCGNGKYLTVRNDVFIVASDRSSELLKFAAQHQPHSAVIADSISLPHPTDTFDFAICIAVVHHLSTPDRRRQGIRAILATLTPETISAATVPNAKISSRRGGQALIFVWALEQKNSRRGWDAGHEQDVLVPWVLKQESAKTNKKSKDRKMRSANEATTGEQNDTAETPIHEAADVGQTYQRYYHLYREGELEDDIVAAGGKVVRKGYDRDNWWAICERVD